MQTAASGVLVDLPGGSAFAIFMFSICDLWINPDKFRAPARWVVLFLAAFAAANIKMQTSVFVALAMPLDALGIWRLLRARTAAGTASATPAAPPAQNPPNDSERPKGRNALAH